MNKLCCMVRGKKYCGCGWQLCGDCYKELTPTPDQESVKRLNRSHSSFNDSQKRFCSNEVILGDTSALPFLWK